MSSGTEILNKVISFQHQARWVTKSQNTPGPHPQVPKTGSVVVAKHHQTSEFLRHIFCNVTAAAARGSWADFWLIVHTGAWIQCTRIQWGQWLKYLPTLCGHSWTLPPVENFAYSVLSHHICRHRYLDFGGLSLAPLRSIKFNTKHPKSCVKKILITVTIFLKKKTTSPKPKITMYTHASCSFSEKKNEMACKKKKNNTFKNNIVTCYSFCKENTVIAVYKQKR